jgi:hypothetical protein
VGVVVVVILYLGCRSATTPGSERNRLFSTVVVHFAHGGRFPPAKGFGGGGNMAVLPTSV